MKIEIKLGDPKYCDGCPCLQASYFGGSPDCGQYYDIEDNREKYRKSNQETIRPPECINAHGE